MGLSNEDTSDAASSRKFMPTPLGRCTENIHQKTKPNAGGGGFAGPSGTASNCAQMEKAGGAKRRLTPMELKQQQRQQREQRKRAKLSQSQSTSAGEHTGANPSSSEDHADGVRQTVNHTDTENNPTKNTQGFPQRSALSPGPRGRGGAVPPDKLLRRSASSPPSINCSTRPSPGFRKPRRHSQGTATTTTTIATTDGSQQGTASPRAPPALGRRSSAIDRRRQRPPPSSGLATSSLPFTTSSSSVALNHDGDGDDSRTGGAIGGSGVGDDEEEEAIEGRAGLCYPEGSNIGDSRHAHGNDGGVSVSAADEDTIDGIIGDGLAIMSGSCSGGDSRGEVRSNESAENSRRIAERRDAGGRGAGAAGASLFSMVMSGASCSGASFASAANSSRGSPDTSRASPGVGADGSGEWPEPEKGTAAERGPEKGTSRLPSSRAEGGTVSSANSTLSSLLLRQRAGGKNPPAPGGFGLRGRASAAAAAPGGAADGSMGLMKSVDADRDDGVVDTTAAADVFGASRTGDDHDSNGVFAQEPACGEEGLTMDAPTSMMGLAGNGGRRGGRGGSGGRARNSAADWMAVELDKLSDFRVAETRMGFPEGGAGSAREGSLRRSVTLPTGDAGKNSKSHASSSQAFPPRYPNDRHWQLGSPFPLGNAITTSQINNTPVATGDSNRNSSLSSSSSLSPQTPPAMLSDSGDCVSSSPAVTAANLPTPTPAVDLPLRTRARFEMAAGIPIPAGISGVPGQLEFRALKAFAAGDTGVVPPPPPGGSAPRPRQQQQGQRQSLDKMEDDESHTYSDGENGEENDQESKAGGGAAAAGGCTIGGMDCGKDSTEGARPLGPWVVGSGVNNPATSSSGGGGGVISSSAVSAEGQTGEIGVRRERMEDAAMIDREDARVAEGRTPEAVEAAEAMGAEEEEEAAEEEREEAMEQWRKATLYWAHPSTPLPQEALGAQKTAHARVMQNPGEATKARGSVHPGGSSETGWTSFFLSRRRDWEQAFASLYYGLLAKKKEHDRKRSASDRRRRRRRRRGGDSAARGVVVNGDTGVPQDGGDGVGGGSVGIEGFYLQCPRYTVHWTLVEDGGGSGVRLTPAAAMTQSTRRLRNRLREAGIDFEMPLDPAGDGRDAQADEDMLEEWKALRATGSARPGSTYVNEEDSRPHLSVLVFKGQMAVHGLFDFLLETCGSPAVMGGSAGNSGVPGRSSSRRGSRGGGGGGRAGDVPLLLSREPFLNASLKSLKVRQNGSVHVHRSRSGVGSSETSDLQVLELVGHILPSALSDLSHAMARACNAFSPRLPPPLTAAADGSSEVTAPAAAVEHGDRELLSSGNRGGDGNGDSGTAYRKTAAGSGGKEVEARNDDDIAGDDDRSEGRSGRSTESGGRDLFRAVFSVDPTTSHLNAALSALRASSTAAPAVAAAGESTPIVPVRGNYCSETRAREVLLPAAAAAAAQRWRGDGATVVFDVCSAEPLMTALV